MSTELIARIRSARMSWIDLGGGKRLRIIRPPEAEFSDFLSTGGNVSAQWAIDRVVKYAEGWEGFSEADLMGAELAPGDAMPPFSKELWEIAVSDNQNWLTAATTGLLDVIRTYISKKAESAKN